MVGGLEQLPARSLDALPGNPVVFGRQQQRNGPADVIGEWTANAIEAREHVDPGGVPCLALVTGTTNGCSRS
jgi:hypothetical protein